MTGRDNGRIRLAGGYQSHGEAVRRIRNKRGAVSELWWSASRLWPEARIAAELERRYRTSRNSVLGHSGKEDEIMVRLVVLIWCGLLMIPTAHAASPLLEQALGLSGFAMWSDSGAPGLVIGAVRGDESIVLGFGTVRPKSVHPELPNPEPDGRTLIRLGSISKAFAGELLAGLVVDGRVRLTDPLARWLPGVPVPQFAGRQITLLDLATHSAGLPREMGYAPEGFAPFTWPTAADRAAWLSKFSLAWVPGSVAAYSNVGFDLLGDALARVSSVSYGTLLRDRITGPLGMADTGVSPDAGQCGRMMMGTGLGAPSVPVCGDTEATAASGGVYSTANDMVVWLRHLLSVGDPALVVSQAVYRMRQTMPAAIGFDEAGPMAGLGLSWVMQAADGARPMILEKSGGGGGFMTYVAFAPGRGVGVFVAVDRLDFGMFYGLTAGANQVLGNLAAR